MSSPGSSSSSPLLLRFFLFLLVLGAPSGALKVLELDPLDDLLITQEPAFAEDEDQEDMSEPFSLAALSKANLVVFEEDRISTLSDEYLHGTAIAPNDQAYSTFIIQLQEEEKLHRPLFSVVESSREDRTSSLLL